MISDQDLRELLSYQAKHAVLSVYLNTDPAEGSPETYKLHLRSMLKNLRMTSSRLLDILITNMIGQDAAQLCFLVRLKNFSVLTRSQFRFAAGPERICAHM